MLEKYAKSVIQSHLDGLPRHLILFVTSRCNLKCKQCFYWEDMDLNQGKFDIKIEEVEALVGSKTLQKLMWLQIGGGEPQRGHVGTYFTERERKEGVSVKSRMGWRQRSRRCS